MKLAALIFDVGGTLADTEDLHRQAFNEALADEGLAWHWDAAQYTELLRVAGGKERIRHGWPQRGPDRPARDEATVQRLHSRKTAVYARRVAAGVLRLLDGLAGVTPSLLHSWHAQFLTCAEATPS